jgi:hypothetical protein
MLGLASEQLPQVLIVVVVETNEGTFSCHVQGSRQVCGRYLKVYLTRIVIHS